VTRWYWLFAPFSGAHEIIGQVDADCIESARAAIPYATRNGQLFLRTSAPYQTVEDVLGYSPLAREDAKLHTATCRDVEPS